MLKIRNLTYVILKNGKWKGKIWCLRMQKSCLLLNYTGKNSNFLYTLDGMSNTANVSWIYWDLQRIYLSYKGKRI